MPDPTDTDQSRFWRGEFGSDYMGRNSASAEHLRARVAMWSKILGCVAGDRPQSILEVGSNIGNNLRALRALTGAELFALEPHADARRILVDDGVVPADHAIDAIASAIPLADASMDLVFTSGVLIHIDPEQLLPSVREIHRVARRYVVCVEYFSARPETIPYRGHQGRLFKRDFGGYYLDQFPDLRAVDCGFCWKRLTGLDDLTWWLFEKRP